jgi:hypothetical protein
LDKLSTPEILISVVPQTLPRAAMPSAARFAGRTVGEALASVARAKQKQIRTKPLKLLDSRPGKQAITGDEGGSAAICGISRGS